MKDSPQLPILNWSVILDCFSPQDDATVKCWGWKAPKASLDTHTLSISRPLSLSHSHSHTLTLSNSHTLTLSHSVLSRRRTTRPSSAGAGTTMDSLGLAPTVFASLIGYPRLLLAAGRRDRQVLGLERIRAAGSDCLICALTVLCVP